MHIQHGDDGCSCAIHIQRMQVFSSQFYLGAICIAESINSLNRQEVVHLKQVLVFPNN